MTNKHVFSVVLFIFPVGRFEESPQDQPDLGQQLKKHLDIIESISVKIPEFYWGSGEQTLSQWLHPFFPSFFLFRQIFLMKAHRDAHPHKTIKNNEISIKNSYREKMCELQEKKRQ